MKTRIISIVLILAMLASSLAAVVYSADETPNYPFTDVPEWAIGVVNTVYEKGIMNGTGATTFGPDGSFTREQIAATLYRISGATDTATAEDLAAVFADAAKVSTWAVSAVKWAYDNEVTTGITAGTALNFEPQGTLTREQAATMIMRFIAKMGIPVSSDGTATVKDIDKVSGWALDNVKASIAAGIITGDQNGYFNPAGATNRISAAAMLARIPEAKREVWAPIFSQDANDPNPDNLGLSPNGGATFKEDIKISKSITISDGSAKNLFSATGMGVHGWHESRIVRSEYGTYVVFAQDERIGDKYEAYSSGYNGVVWGKFFLVKITDDGFEKVLEGEYPVHAGSCAPDVLAGEDGMIYVTTFSDDKDSYYGSLDRTQNPPFTREAAFLTVYEFDTKTDTLVAKGHDIIDFDLIGVHGYGYYQPIVDTVNGKIYALFTGGEVPGYLSWFIYDMETHTWEKENYLVETKYRNSYFHAYPDGKGGIFFVSQANPPSDAVEADYNAKYPSDPIKFTDFGYLFQSVNLYKIPNMYKEEVELIDAIYDPDYTDRRKFPEVGKKDGATLIESASAAHYSEGTTYLASNGYLYVIYKYADPSSSKYMYVVYDTLNNFKEVTKNNALNLMLTAKNKIGTTTYQFTISEAMSGDVYLTAINVKPKEATMEIYKLSIDTEGKKLGLAPMIVNKDDNTKAASIRLQMNGSSSFMHHGRVSYTSSRNSSIQDNILGVLTFSGDVSGRETTLCKNGFQPGQYSTVNWSGGPETYNLTYYSIQWPTVK